MPVIAAWLSGLVASIIPLVAQFIGKKFAMVGVFLVLGATLIAALNLALSGLVFALPGSLGAGLAFLPANTGQCIAAYFTAQVAIATYDAHMGVLRIKIDS
jgi:hypothetical protein